MVSPEEKHRFIRAAVSLVDDSLSFDRFQIACSQLVKEFPKTKGWLSWYLQPNRVELCFPACSNICKKGRTRLQKIKPDTNAQEGLGGFIQQLAGRQKLAMKALIEQIVNVCINHDRRSELAESGTQLRYARNNRRTPQAKKRGEESKRGYRPPDTAATLATKRQKRNSLAAEETSLAPEASRVPQMVNLGNTCYMSSLVQLFLASPLATDLVSREICCPKTLSNCPHAFSRFSSVVKKLSKMEPGADPLKPQLLVESVKTEFLKEKGFVEGEQNCPADYLRAVVADLEEATCCSSGLGSRANIEVVPHYTCSGSKCGGHVRPATEAEGSETCVLTCPYESEGVFTISDCLKNATAEEPIPDRCGSCGRMGGMTKSVKLSPVKEPRLLFLQFPPTEHHVFPGSAGERPEFVEAEKSATVVVQEEVDLAEVTEGGRKSTGHLVGYIHFNRRMHHYTSITRSGGAWVKSDDLCAHSPEVVAGQVGGANFPQPHLALYEVHPHGSRPSFEPTLTSAVEVKVEGSAQGRAESGAEVKVQVKGSAQRRAERPATNLTPVASQVFGPAVTSELAAAAESLCARAKREPEDKMFRTRQSCVLAPMLFHLKGNKRRGELLGQVEDGLGVLTGDFVHWKIPKKLGFASEAREFVGDEAVCAFAEAFNERESRKVVEDPGHTPSWMFNSRQTFKVVGDEWTFPDADKDLAKKLKVLEAALAGEGPDQTPRKVKRAAVDIFKCHQLIFPVNEVEVHWSLICVEVSTMKQTHVCSLHGRQNRKWAEKIHEWLLHYHQLRHGCELQVKGDKGQMVRCPVRLTDDMIPDVRSPNRSVAHQSPHGMDCLLHTCANAALLGDGRDFQETRGLDPDLFGRELRARMVLFLDTGRFMFDRTGCPPLELPEEGTVDLVSTDSDTDEETKIKEEPGTKEESSGEADKEAEVRQEPGTKEKSWEERREEKMASIEEMRKKLAKAKEGLVGKERGKKEKCKEAAARTKRTTKAGATEGWCFLRPTAERAKGPSPTCVTCKEPIERDTSTRICYHTQFTTRNGHRRTRTVQMHCRDGCVAGFEKPKELKNSPDLGEEECTKEELLRKEWEKGYLEENLDLKRVLDNCRGGEEGGERSRRKKKRRKN